MNKGQHAIIVSGLLIALLAIAIPSSSESFAKPEKCTPWPGCRDGGGGGGGGKTPFDFGFILSSNSISIDQGSSDNIDVTVTRISGTGNVNLSVTNAPTGVTVSFDPSSRKVSSNNPSYTSTMSIVVSPSANPGTVSLDVQASGKGTTKVSTLDLEVVEVTTPPPPPEDPVIVAAGDIVCNTSSYTSNTCRHAQTSDRMMAINPDAVLTLGDNQYQSGELSNYNTYYDPTWGRAFDKTFPSPGNHEYGTSYAAGYSDYFGTRTGDPNNEYYYSFDIGSWHIVSLNSNCSEEGVGGCSTNSPQGVWLKNDLETHDNACTLVYWHHPRFSWGSHGDNSKMDYFWQLLDANNVDVALAGHDHNYQRFAPMDLTGSYDENGVREFVVGTGGKSHYSTEEDPPTVGQLEVLNTSTFGVLKMTLHDTSYDWEFIGESGNTIDSGSWNCNVN